MTKKPCNLRERTMYRVPSVSQRLGECPSCFEPLAGQPIVMLENPNGKHCLHYLHARCSQLRPPKGTCSVCHQSFRTIEPFPSIDNPQAWFNAVDVDRDGRLSQLEVVAALKATVTSLDVDRFDKDIASLWINWDANGDGFISYDEIFRESYGLLAYIREQYPARCSQQMSPPPLTDSYQWFSYWDTDGSDTLDKAEVHRALVKTFDLEGDPTKTHTMGATLNAVWGLFDLDNNGTIDRMEFSAPDGLGATLAANLAHMKRRVYPIAQPQVPTQQFQEEQYNQGTQLAAVSVLPACDVLSFNAITADVISTGPEQQLSSVPAAELLPGYLPPYWEERLDPKGRIYYANSATRQTQWERPTE